MASFFQTNPMLFDSMKSLRLEVESILKEIDKDKDKDTIDGAVNWADLGVTDVAYTLDENNEEGWIVYISEADPSNDEFAFQLRHRINKLGWKNVEFILEW